MQKNFNDWNESKKRIDSDPNPNLFPQAGEVWICAIGLNVGFEQNGSRENFSRPVLIIKKFNNKMFWIAPLSAKQKKLDFYYNFTDKHNQNVAVILAQLRLLSVKRFERKMYNFPEENFSEVVNWFIDNFLPKKSKSRLKRDFSEPEGAL